MASRPRNYQAAVPVAVTSRFALRLPILEQPELKKLLAQLLARYAQRCQVEILWWIAMSTHLQATLVQRFNGHDKERRIGIAPFLRNCLAVFTKTANGFYSTQGRLTERTYRSHLIKTNQRLLQSQAYTLGNPCHHRAGSWLDLAGGNRAWRVYAQGEPDGVVTSVPLYHVQLAEEPQQRATLAREMLDKIITTAVALEGEGEPLPWRQAVDRYFQEHPAFMGIERLELPALVPISEIVDRDQLDNVRKGLLDWKWPRIKFDPRRAPHMGELISILVVRDRPPPEDPP